MNLSDSQLDQLFEGVRKEKPVVSYEETRRAFLKATVLAAGGTLATKSILKLFNIKQWIMMISVLSVLTAGTLLVTLNSSPVESGREMSNKLAPKEEIETTNEQTEKEKSTHKQIAELQKLNSKLTTLNPEPLEIFIEPGKPPVEVRAYLRSDGSYHFVYVITSETTPEDLKELQEKAKAAGIELICEPDFSDNKLRHLSMSIIQKTENGHSSNIQISDINLEETPEYSVAWNVDEEGTATTIACGEPTGSKEVEALLADINIEEMTSEMERLLDSYETEIAVISEANRIEIESYAQELAMAEELLQREDIQKILKELDAIGEEEMQEIMEELEEAMEELEEYEVKVLNDCEKLRRECENHQHVCDEGYKEILEEMQKDGLIKDNAKRMKMQVNDDRIKVNGKELPDDLRKKYEDLVRKHLEVDLSEHEGRWTWVYTD